MQMASSPPPEASDLVFRKIAYRLLPFILLLYFVCYIDRVNIGFAKLQFLDDLHLTDAHYGFAAGLFYVTYSLFDIPSNLMLARVGVRKTLLRIMILWGVVSGAQMFIRNASDLYILRLLFGAAEAGFIPGIMLYLTFWFPVRYRARITSLFFVGVPLSGIIGAPLSGMIMQHMNGLYGLRGWQWLFLVFAIPAIFLGVISYFYLDDGPKSAGWLSDNEKQVVTDELKSDGLAGDRGNKGSFAEAMRDPRIYAMALLNFAANTASNTATFWIPSVLKNVGLGSVERIGWVTGGISIVAAAGMLLIARSSDALMERRWHFVGCALITAGAYLLLPLASSSIPGTILLMAVGAVGGIGLLTIYWTIPTSYLRGRGAAGAIGFVSMVGAVGSAVSPSLIGWLRETTGSLYVGLGSTVVIVLASAALVLLAIPKNEIAVSDQVKVRAA
ncbi:MFS transporter, ACS family, phthalate transporter [Bradyrhizobium canariense]|uniref:MFS transporter, ACS family, phthalate transporter n=2 Tax=Bradyrhizobium canariense TaxID=255045 RepID=A0A1H1PHV2_9BRAD|nr:MFS transporter, ACS family, phthalate transporter [Bradyrhizobium canariense]